MTASPTPLVPADHRQVLQLFQHIPRYHAHIDWQNLTQWLSDPNFHCWVIRKNGLVQSLLGATVHVPPKGTGDPAAWLRFAIPDQSTLADSVLDRLWDVLRQDLQAAGITQVGLLASHEWIERPIARWGFERTNAVVTMRRRHGDIPLPQPQPSLTIREAAHTDLESIAWIDALAFGPIWQYDLKILSIAARQAATFTVLERDREMLGYQLSTQYPGSSHLARLAVRPTEQGHGLGGLLVGEMLKFFQERRIKTTTVNTQEDNIRSQHLYKRFGFEFTGEQAPVWTRWL